VKILTNANDHRVITKFDGAEKEAAYFADAPRRCKIIVLVTTHHDAQQKANRELLNPRMWTLLVPPVRVIKATT
jgi:hypothetical protein